MSDQHPSTLPPKPEKPDPQDCCGGGCSPCILELYEDELERWRARVRAIRQQPAAPSGCKPKD